jgi:nitrous oxidase accessory protein
MTGLLVIAGALVLAFCGARSAPVASAATSKTLYVAAGATAGTGGSCAGANFSTVRAAIVAARAGDTVVVCSGTYAEGVHLSKAVTLQGSGQPVIDATGLDSGVLVTASKATVSGLTVMHSTGEGIFLRSVRNVLVENNTVTHNDLGAGTSVYSECDPKNGTPDSVKVSTCRRSRNRA